MAIQLSKPKPIPKKDLSQPKYLKRKFKTARILNAFKEGEVLTISEIRIRLSEDPITDFIRAVRNAKEDGYIKMHVEIGKHGVRYLYSVVKNE